MRARFRKWSLDKGSIFAEWLEEMTSFVQKNKDHTTFKVEFEVLGDAIQAYRELMDTVSGYISENIRLVPLYSTRILRITAELYAGCLLMQQALVAQEKLGQENSIIDFYSGKIHTAQFYVNNIVPDVMATVPIIKKANASAINIPEAAF